MKPNDNTIDPVVRSFMKVDRLHHACCDMAVASMGSGLHRNQHRLLMYLAHHDGDISQKDIAAHFDVSPAAVANILKALEQQGYIERKADASDTRRNIVDITEKGNRILDETKDAFDNIDRQMTKGLSDKDIQVFFKCLDTMADNLKKIMEEESR